MKTIKNILSLGLVALTFTACSDVADEITELTLGRVMSPLDIEARNVNETTANILWTASAGAVSYNIEVFADDSLTFAGTPEQTLSSATNSTSLSNLNYDTKYSVRVQAISEDGTRDSKFHGVYFKTSAKQFLKNPKPAEIADRSVTLKWEVEEGYDVSTIVIGNITHEITAEEKEAGEATVEGLEPETTYTAYLYYNGKQCGNRSFTTIADLAGAILVHEGDNLTTIIGEAEEDATLALYGGTYELNVNGETGKAGAVKIEKSITIKGIYPTDQPTIKGRFEINGGSFTLSQVILDGADNGTTDQAFNFKTADAIHKVFSVQNCTIQNFTKGLFYLNVTAIVEEMTFDNCIFANIECNGGDMFDSRKGYIGKFTLSNSTIYNSCKGRSMLRYDNSSDSFSGKAAPEILIESCTLDNVESEPAGTSNMNGIAYVRYGGNTGHKITIKNNLITNTVGGTFSKNTATATPEFSNNAYFNCNTGLFNNVEGASCAADTSGKNGEDPKYKDAENGDFTIGNEGVSKLKVGDPRWLPAQ
ncbi:MAG: DUF4957 domain-containing protein [Prevotella sp.]|nr:DUF4957 domain-containing protein [Prevotella sp.]